MANQQKLSLSSQLLNFSFFTTVIFLSADKARAQHHAL
jgi:hypothetical protein